MRDSSAPAPVTGHRSQFNEALRHIEKIVTDGVCHGFFECSIACEMTNGGKRQIVVRAGKSHKFHIPENELPR
jgi:hypothetical protein